jgi:hypothetical protein
MGSSFSACVTDESSPAITITPALSSSCMLPADLNSRINLCKNAEVPYLFESAGFTTDSDTEIYSTTNSSEKGEPAATDNCTTELKIIKEEEEEKPAVHSTAEFGGLTKRYKGPEESSFNDSDENSVASVSSTYVSKDKFTSHGDHDSNDISGNELYEGWSETSSICSGVDIISSSLRAHSEITSNVSNCYSKVIMSHSLKNPSILVGWEVYVENLGVGHVIAVQKMRFFTRRYVIQFQSGRKKSVVLKQSDKIKSGSNFTLLRQLF